MTARPAAFAIVLVGALLVASGCQDYPFAFRKNQKIEAQRLNQLVATLTPVDILFMVDNSATMKDETDQLKNNVERFVTELADQGIDFQLGIVTPDVECNMPNRVCTGAGAWSYSCCARNLPVCSDTKNPAGDTYVGTNCEPGRLQGKGVTGTRIFKTPAPADKSQFVSDFIAAIDFSLRVTGTPALPSGTAYESGLQSVALAVACSIGSPDCDDLATGNAAAAMQLDSGFIRDNADLIIILMSDEDDCSAGVSTIYRRPDDPTSATDQAAHFCDQDECYGYYNGGKDANGNGLDDWWDPATSGTNFRPKCGIGHNIERVVNPPGLQAVSTFIDKLVAYKGGDTHRVRAAAIVSAVQPAHSQIFQGDACYGTPNGPSAECGCTAGADDLSCYVTAANNQGDTRLPLRSDTPGGPIDPLNSGCLTAPGNRYVQFLGELAERHAAAGLAPDVLTDSICRSAYDATMDSIVNNVIIPKCFQLSAIPTSPDFLSVTLNGSVLPNVPVGSTKQGWSWQAGSQEICLEAGLTKQVGDRFEVLQVTATQ